MADRDIWEDFERAAEEAEEHGGNPFHKLVDDMEWSPSEVFERLIADRDELDAHASEFVADWGLMPDGAYGFRGDIEDPDDLEDFVEDMREGDD